MTRPRITDNTKRETVAIRLPRWLIDAIKADGRQLGKMCERLIIAEMGLQKPENNVKTTQTRV